MRLLKQFLLYSSLLGVISGKRKASQSDDNINWGHADNSDTSVKPYKIQVSDEEITDLKCRLNNTKLVPPLPASNFTYGFNTDVLKTWLDYWATEYDFKERFAKLNKEPQYSTVIQGLNIQFLWAKPEGKSRSCKTVPVLIIHDFPGSFHEFLQTYPHLTKCVDGIAMEVVLPNLPGVGFSDGAKKSGFGAIQVASVLVKLMERLGHKQFYLQSEDTLQIGAAIATYHPKNILGYHTNFAVSYNPLSLAMWIAGSVHPPIFGDPETEYRMYPIYNKTKQLLVESGYFHLMATKPDTAGIALSDSPAALAAVVLQVALLGLNSGYTNKPDGGVSALRRADFTDNLSMFWFSNGFTSTARLLAETFNEASAKRGLFTKKAEVPTYVLQTKDDYIYQTSVQLKIKYPILLHKELVKCCEHFVAYKHPEVYAKSLRNAIAMFKEYNEGDICLDV